MTTSRTGCGCGRGGSPEELARAVVHAAWSGRFLECADLLADDFIWIGGLPAQYCLGRAETLSVYEGGARTIPSITFADDDFREVASLGGVHVVCGSTTVMTDPSTGMVYSGRPRTTAVFREAGDGLQLVHLHTSHPVPKAPGGGWVHTSAGISRETLLFICELSVQYGDEASLELRDLEGTTHVLRPFEIICLEADRQYTDVHLIGSTFRMRRGIGSLAKALPQRLFIELRRGTVANVSCVTSWDRGEVCLVDGMVIPLPNRRATEILALLAEKRAAFEEDLDKMGAKLFAGKAGRQESM